VLAWIEHGVLKQLRGKGEASRGLTEGCSRSVVTKNTVIPVALPHREGVSPNGDRGCIAFRVADRNRQQRRGEKLKAVMEKVGSERSPSMKLFREGSRGHQGDQFQPGSCRRSSMVHGDMRPPWSGGAQYFHMKLLFERITF